MLTEFDNRIVDVDTAVSDMWARIDPRGEVAAVDCLIAATALVRGWTVVTRNERDFVRTGVPVFNPFEAA
ncbi:MAG: toxin FitB [Pseudonocardiales bacterium]|nr:toxin FitB [Pseudonocardiales bacterium]